MTLPLHQVAGQALLDAGHSGLTVTEIVEKTAEKPRLIAKLLRKFEAASMAYTISQRDGEDVWCLVRGADVSKPPVPARGLKEVKHHRQVTKKKSPRVVEEKKRITDNYLDCIRAVAMVMPEFSSDEPMRKFEELGHSFGSQDPRLSGSVFSTAVKLGIVQKLNKHKVSDRRAGGLARMYKSCLYEGPLKPEETQEGDAALLEEVKSLRSEVARLSKENEQLRKGVRAACNEATAP